MDQTRPMEAGKEVKCSKGKRGRREAGQMRIPLRLVAPGGPADFNMVLYVIIYFLSFFKLSELIKAFWIH